MLDRFAPLAHLLRMLVEPALNGFDAWPDVCYPESGQPPASRGAPALDVSLG
jgi:hypothetical protein